MKTQTTKRILFALCFQALLGLVGCGKSDSGSSTAAAPQYSVSNGQCYSNGVYQPNTALCAGAGNGYQYSGTNCVATANPTVPVNPTYCQQTGYNSGFGITTGVNQGIAQPCIGDFRTVTGIPAQGRCQISNCSGYTLMSLQTFQIITCL